MSAPTHYPLAPIALATCIALIASAAAFGQEADAGGRVFAQIGLANNRPAPDDAPLPGARPRFEPGHVWDVGGGVMVRPRWGIGAEWRRAPGVTFAFGNAASSVNQTDEE